ncbi:hypothetical protein AMS68_001138 [Peltaster fructicola]|uniref:SCP domain-containing protein n=1 Tax=Peltaster fructicola TaxID=286661 RepID=A0A6H0XLV4_9PEZI|nr:hypothetical protein AMS68_001138 [Peltaster fructicola]
MFFSALTILSTLALSANAAAVSLPGSTQCRTLYGLTKTSSFSTTWSIGSTPCVTVSSITVTTTKTPSASTSTVTTTQTSSSTAPVSTLTATSTAFSTQTTTVTTTTTATSVTAVDSTYTPTYTSSTTSGFIPIRSSIPGANSYSGSGGQSPVQKRETSEEQEVAAPLERRATSSYHANKVECIVYTASSTCSTQRVTSTSTVMAPVPTTTTTTTTTITSVAYPSATTTVTTTNIVTTTTTATSTTTTVSTTTNLVAAPTQTFYQICAELNFADTYQGQWINSVYNNGQPYSDYYGSTTSSAYDCCVNAYIHSRDSEPVGIWNYNPPSNFRVIQSENCNAYVQRAAGSQANGKGGAIYSQQTSQGVIGNGPYGEVTVMYTS